MKQWKHYLVILDLKESWHEMDPSAFISKIFDITLSRTIRTDLKMTGTPPIETTITIQIVACNYKDAIIIVKNQMPGWQFVKMTTKV